MKELAKQERKLQEEKMEWTRLIAMMIYLEQDQVQREPAKKWKQI